MNTELYLMHTLPREPHLLCNPEKARLREDVLFLLCLREAITGVQIRGKMLSMALYSHFEETFEREGSDSSLLRHRYEAYEDELVGFALGELDPYDASIETLSEIAQTLNAITGLAGYLAGSVGCSLADGRYRLSTAELLELAQPDEQYYPDWKGKNFRDNSPLVELCLTEIDEARYEPAKLALAEVAAMYDIGTWVELIETGQDLRMPQRLKELIAEAEEDCIELELPEQAARDLAEWLGHQRYSKIADHFCLLAGAKDFIKRTGPQDLLELIYEVCAREGVDKKVVANFFDEAFAERVWSGRPLQR